ncbi:hypothetical protein Thiosp_01476 [Thiorhodovibrio litoralis]|nr:hypothetical protein Thiosp_01476 [Thiorhodovibrio litoralis]
MATLQRLSLIGMGLLLGGVVLAQVGAQQTLLADASQSWAIRPAGEAEPVMQPADAVVSPSTPSSDAGSLEIKTDGDIRYVSGGIGVSERTDLQTLSSQFNLHLSEPRRRRQSPGSSLRQDSVCSPFREADKKAVPSEMHNHNP